MKTIISEARLRSLIAASLDLSSKGVDCSRISYLTTDGAVVDLHSVVVGQDSEFKAENDAVFLRNPENWKHPKNLPEFMMQPVHDLPLSSVKLYRLLQNAGISKIWHLVVCYDNLSKIKGLGKVYFAEIADILFRLPDYNHVFSLHLRGRATAWAITEHIQFEGDLLRLMSVLDKSPEKIKIMDKYIFSETQAFVF